jgi:hypothetical protein
MMLKRLLLATCLGSGIGVALLRADERRFAYVYEPETPAAGAWEFENWATWRQGRDRAVGQASYDRWDVRHEIEVGVTDRYAVELSLNETFEHYRDAANGAKVSRREFQGVSLENRYLVLNPAEHPIGLTLYLEGRYARAEQELEAKLILGQRRGAWKWAVNLVSAIEWKDDGHTREGELEADFGVARDLDPRWSLGLEFRHHSVWPDFRVWENAALFAGPTLAYHRARWQAVLAVLPQVHGWNSSRAPDGSRSFELLDHERLNVRLLVGIDF